MPTLEDRVSTLEDEVKGIAEAVKLQGRINESRFAAVFAEFDHIKLRLDKLENKVDALPRALAEMLEERSKG